MSATGGGSEVEVAGARAEPTSAQLDAARERVESVEPGVANVGDQWRSLDEREQAHVASLADSAMGQSEPKEHFRESMIRSMASGDLSGPSAATLAARAHPSDIQGFATASPTSEQASSRLVPPVPDDPGNIRTRRYQTDDLIGGADMSDLIPPGPPPRPPTN